MANFKRHFLRIVNLKIVQTRHVSLIFSVMVQAIITYYISNQRGDYGLSNGVHNSILQISSISTLLKNQVTYYFGKSIRKKYHLRQKIVS